LFAPSLAISALFAASFAACQVAQAAIIVPTALATPITCVVKDVMLEKNGLEKIYQ
jgi:hypothetical protein